MQVWGKQCDLLDSGAADLSTRQLRLKEGEGKAKIRGSVLRQVRTRHSCTRRHISIFYTELYMTSVRQHLLTKNELITSFIIAISDVDKASFIKNDALCTTLGIGPTSKITDMIP